MKTTDLQAESVLINHPGVPEQQVQYRLMILVRQNDVEKVDFIKMDIEGAEMPALHGALEVITKYKPKICYSNLP